MAIYKITFSKSNWDGGTEAIWFDTVQQSFFGDADCTQEVTAIAPPTRELYRFTGYYSASSGGTQYIDDAGNFTDAFLSLSITAAKTFYAQGTQVAWKLTLDDNNGEGGSGAFYYRIDGGGFFDNYLCEGEPVSSVEKPWRDGYAFAGYYNGTSTPGTQYVDQDCGFTAALDSLTLTAAKTIYARWVAPYKITVNANSGTGGTSAFYFDSVSGKFYTGTDFSEAITAILPHSRECFAFVGCYSGNNTTSTIRVSSDGTIASDWTPTAAATIYAQSSVLYYRIDGGGYYVDDLCTEPADSITLPTRSGYVLKGYYSSSSSGTKYIDRFGDFLPDFEALTLTAAKTIYAQWKAAYKVTFNKSSGTGGTDAIWYSPEDDAFFADAACTIPATSVTIPVRECYRFNGYFNTSSGSTQYVDANGDYTSALSSLSISSAKTFYAQWTRVSYKATLNDNGGEGGSGAFYYDGSTDGFYADDQLTTPTTAVATPNRAGYNFIGYYATTSGGSRYVAETGSIVVAVTLTADMTIYARWQAREYTITFDYNGGTGDTVSKVVTFGSPIGALPEPTRDRASFDGWYVGGYNMDGIVYGGDQITASRIWDIAEDTTVTASWFFYFGGVKDFFGLTDENLIPISSDSGDHKPRTCVSNATWSGSRQTGGAGRYSPGVNDTGGVWLNPTVTYRLVGNRTIELQLGKAYPAKRSGNVMTVSGYMITSVKVSTSVGNFPTVTVSAVANEGVNAINLFNVSIPVVARARAQYLLGAISGGGSLQTCDVEASCTPVVCAENNMPCASDVVAGRYVAKATTYSPDNGAAPAAANGFTSVGEPISNGDRDYPMYSITAEKEID